jgi:hypothetical protein
MLPLPLLLEPHAAIVNETASSQGKPRYPNMNLPKLSAYLPFKWCLPKTRAIWQIFGRNAASAKCN